MSHAQVAVVMGSKSDWETMRAASEILAKLNISYHAQIISAHRTPDLLYEFAKGAKNKRYHVIIAGAGGSAHLPGMLAAMTPLPVIGVPVKSAHLNGMDSLLSIAQMPKGVPVATMSIGYSGAMNAGLLAASILSLHDEAIAQAYSDYRYQQTAAVLEETVIELS